jgi:hypothetical protein
VSLTESQRREGIEKTARERLDRMNATGAREANGQRPTYDSCHQRVQRAVVSGDLKRQGN